MPIGQVAQNLPYFFVYNYPLTRHPKSVTMARGKRSTAAEFSIIPQPAHFVNRKSVQIIYGKFPEFCAIFCLTFALLGLIIST